MTEVGRLAVASGWGERVSGFGERRRSTECPQLGRFGNQCTWIKLDYEAGLPLIFATGLIASAISAQPNETETYRGKTILF